MAIEPLLGTKAQKFFIGTITLQAIVVLTMVGIIFGMVEPRVDLNSDSRYKTLPCYLALFALAEIFELVMAFDALRLRNSIQLFGILAFHTALIVFASLQVTQTRTALVQTECANVEYAFYCNGSGERLFKRVEPFLIVAPIMISLALATMSFWVKELYSEFGWTIFHVVGANPRMKSMYEYYQIMLCLLKFDFFCFTGVTMQLLIVVLRKDSAEFAVTITAIPVVLILLGLCSLALQREIKWLMSASLALMLAAQTYLYKLVRFYQPSSRAQYRSTRATLTFFTIVAFLLLFATFAVGLRCFADFERGLLDAKMSSVSSERRRRKSRPDDKGEVSEAQRLSVTDPPLLIE